MWRCQTFALEREAKAWRDRLRGELEQGLAVQPTRQTVEEYLLEWLRVASASGHARANTLATYETLVRLYIVPRVGPRPLAELTPLALESMYAELVEGGLAGSTVQRVHSCLRVAVKRALRLRLLAHDPTAGVRVPRAVRREMLYLTAEQASRLLQAAQGEYLFPVLALALATGARPSEYLGLRWADIDLVRERVHIRRALVDVKRPGARQRVAVEDTKTRGSAREVPVTGREVAVLRSWRARQGEARLAAGELWQGAAGLELLVFTDEVGRPLTLSRVGHHLRRLLAAAELPHVRLYDLRHTCATALLTAGVHPKVVAERLGHSSVMQTLDTYSHVVPRLAGDAAEVLGGLFLGWIQAGCKGASDRQGGAP